MKLPLIGILVGLLLMVPIFSFTTVADPKLDIKITGGVGIHVNITNVGNESLFDVILCEIHTKILKRYTSIEKGLTEPLPPGKSLTFRWFMPWIPFLHLYWHQLIVPVICLCNYTVKIYENGGDNTVYAVKNVNALTMFGFVIILTD